MRRSIVSLVVIILISLLLSLPVSAGETPVVRALLFYSPTCPHCHEVLTNGLPPLLEEYGDQLQILLINVQTPGGQELYQAAAAWASLSDDQRVVPLLLVGEEVLIGSIDIPALLPGIVDEGLARGGIDWSAVPGLAEALRQASIDEPADNSAPAEPMPETPKAQPANTLLPDAIPSPEIVNGQDIADAGAATGFSKLMAEDPVAGVLALSVLALLLACLVWAAVMWMRRGFEGAVAFGWRVWVVPVLCVAGIGVAAYLSFVETTGTEAVCGPVGNCNAVQSSPYARLFGVLPVGILGLIGYLLMLGLWLWQRLGSSAWAEETVWLLPVLAFFAVIFSVYLTYVELFVLGAVCIWCISSALIVVLILWAAVRWQVRPLTSSLLAEQSELASDAG